MSVTTETEDIVLVAAVIAVVLLVFKTFNRTANMSLEFHLVVPI